VVSGQDVTTLVGYAAVAPRAGLSVAMR